MSRPRLANLVVAVVVAATVCCDAGPAEMPTVSLVPVASTRVPFSGRNDVTLVDENIVCVTNSYEVRVRCVGRDGSLVGEFGREGEGPGEFPFTPGLVRGPGGTIGTIAQGRLRVFEPSGAMVSETQLPIGYLRAAAPFGAAILGQHFDGGSEVTPIEIDLASGEVLWERPGLDTEVETECRGVALGVASPEGGWTFPACQRELVFFEGRDDPAPIIIRSPTYLEELPNERDLAEIEGRCSRGPCFVDLDAYRNTPKRNHLTIASLAYDDHGRLWVATNRDRDRYSYIDLYLGTEYIGSVRVRDRLLAYDMYGSTLVTVVERELDAAGIGRREVDWYDIGRLGLGLP